IPPTAERALIVVGVAPAATAALIVIIVAPASSSAIVIGIVIAPASAAWPVVLVVAPSSAVFSAIIAATAGAAFLSLSARRALAARLLNGEGLLAGAAGDRLADLAVGQVVLLPAAGALRLDRHGRHLRSVLRRADVRTSS